MKQKGFTLIEMLITGAVVVAIAIVAFVSFTSQSKEVAVNSASEQIIANTRQAESNAATGLQGASWGIHFANTTTTAPFYAIFQGTSYTTTDTLSYNRLPGGVAYSTSSVPSGGTLDVTFSPISGAASASASITIYSTANPSISSTIYITMTGLVGSGSLTNVSSTSGGSGSAFTIYVSDNSNGDTYGQNNDRVEEFNASDTYIGQLGCATGACTIGSAGTNGTFYEPQGIAIDPNGNLWVVDYLNIRAEELSSSGTYIRQIGCSSGTCAYGSSNGQFWFYPSSIAVSGSGTIYAADPNNFRVEEFSPTGTYIGQLGCATGACSDSGANGSFTSIDGVAVNTSGTVYVVDLGTDRVEEFNSAGTYTTQLGCTPAVGDCDNTSTNGGFDAPWGVAIDQRNNDVWVTDNTNNRVEEFSPTGTYIGQLGCASGACAASTTSGTFYNLGYVGVDPSGNVWVVDDNAINYILNGGSGNNRVEEFNASGTYLRQLGCATGACGYSGSNGSFFDPNYVAFDASGNVYVTDNSNDRVQEFSPTGTYIQQFGCASGTCRTSSLNGSFSEPDGVTVDGSGNIYVADVGNNRVEKFNSAGAYLSQLGCSTQTCEFSSSTGLFDAPVYPAADSSGNVWVGDFDNNRVSEFNSAGTLIQQIPCASGICVTSTTSGQFGGSIYAVAADKVNGYLYVVDESNNRVEKFNASGTYMSQLGCVSGKCSTGTTSGKFNSPYGVAVDSSGNAYVADYNNNRVEEFNASGTYIQQFGCASGKCTVGSAFGKINGAEDVAVDPNGSVYVADYNNNRVDIYNASTTAIGQIGCAQGTGACAATSTNGQFDTIENIAIH